MAAETETCAVDCLSCDFRGSCCRKGVWVDLEEAKKIIELDTLGNFYDLKKDEDFPSGYKIGTCLENEKCTFLGIDNLCVIHRINYELKPHYCKEFPLEDGKVTGDIIHLCPKVEALAK